MVLELDPNHTKAHKYIDRSEKKLRQARMRGLEAEEEELRSAKEAELKAREDQLKAQQEAELRAEKKQLEAKEAELKTKQLAEEKAFQEVEAEKQKDGDDKGVYILV